MNEFPNHEGVIYHYLCRNPNLFKKVDPDFFKNKSVSKLFELTKVFHGDYSQLPFSLKKPSLEQITEIVSRDKKAFMVNPDLTEDENAQHFLNNAENVLLIAYDSYNPDFVTETVETWIVWLNFQKGFKLSVAYQKNVKITSSNVHEVINTSKQIFLSRANITFNEGEGKRFFDAEQHVQTQAVDLMNSGYQNLNMFLSGKPNGGFERGTLTMFFGEPNIGKSIFLNNLALNLTMNGTNVLVISLEMGVAKIFKRMGSNAFSIPVNQYAEFSNNVNYVNEQIAELKDRCMSTMIPHGELVAEKFTSATVGDIKVFKDKYEEEHNIKFGALIIDYFTELQNQYGTSLEKSYTFHKQNCNDLFNMAGEDDLAVISAHQINGTDFGSDDLTMSSSAESKAVLHRPDYVFGIIQPASMKLVNKYHVKNIKDRDSGFKNYRSEFNIDYSYMRLTEGALLEPNQFGVI